CPPPLTTTNYHLSLHDALPICENLSLRTFVFLMKASKSVTEYVKKDIGRYDMKTTDFAVLEALYHKGDMTVKQISEAVLINAGRSEEHTSELQSRFDLVCRLLL